MDLAKLSKIIGFVLALLTLGGVAVGATKGYVELLVESKVGRMEGKLDSLISRFDRLDAKLDRQER